MIQGTTSDAGKSTVVAGLCRWLARQGVSVAPFKPQNMALNSAVTREGGEIGRSTALQALACGLEASNDMNPVLLKPQTDVGAQIILRGQVHGNMQAQDYHAFKAQAMDHVMAAWRNMCQQYDVMIVEGAGSPAEINLRQNDIANMGFAEAADISVALVGDIDRGGVFAQLLGTLALLSDSERERVKGLIINRFRGDPSLLGDGPRWLAAHCQCPVVGVLPYLSKLTLDAEDSVQTGNVAGQGAQFRVVVPALPRMSNHNDFDPLRLHPEVDLCFVRNGNEFKGADLIILPGSKHSRSDLAWLKAEGWPDLIHRHLRYGGRVLGICGGYQMLGKTLVDAAGVEGEPGTSEGLGLLALETEIRPGKTLKQLSGTLRGSADIVEGYEIHNGESWGEATQRPWLTIDGTDSGGESEDGLIRGSYLHGLLDHPQACQAILCWAGLKTDAAAQSIDYPAIRQEGLDRLADAMEAHLDARWLQEQLLP